jgi:hypothetical protein
MAEPEVQQGMPPLSGPGPNAEGGDFSPGIGPRPAPARAAAARSPAFSASAPLSISTPTSTSSSLTASGLVTNRLAQSRRLLLLK